MRTNSYSSKRLIKIVIAGLIAVGVPVITSVGIAPPAAAMVAPTLTCAQGGVCALGDTGPGGGIVFYVAPSTFTETGTACATACKYLEAAPISGTNAWIDTEYTLAPGNNLVGASGQAIGTGFDNTKKITDNYVGATAPYGAKAARNYRGPNNLSDWFIPSLNELGQMIANSSSLQMNSSYPYWSSSEIDKEFGIVWTVGGQYESSNKANYRTVRPIRAFAPVAGPSFTLSSSSETSVAGMPISGYTIDATGGSAITSYSISPAINNGLSFDTATGLISGTPIAARSAKAYTITGNNTVGMDSKTFTISVGTRVWTEYPMNSEDWQNIVTSSDGTKFAGLSIRTGIWFSSDAGVTFETRTVQMVAGEYGKSLAASSDLTKLHVVSSLNFVYNSNDSGRTWVRVAGPGATNISGESLGLNWITSSSDGTKVVLVYQVGRIYTSNDSGATWSERTSGNRNWTSVASSSDGSKLVACEFGRSIWTSSDSGVNWTERLGAPSSESWTAVASNSDGTKLVAGVGRGPGGHIWTSSDSGLSWSAQTGSGINRWRAIASSSDGTKLAAVTEDWGAMLTSRDSGVTWSDGGISGGVSIASSSDGNVLATVKQADWIYTSRIVVPAPVAAPVFTLTSSSETATVGIPITGFTIQSTGGLISSFYIAPAPPVWLVFNTSTGALTGSPSDSLTSTEYTIIGFNDSGFLQQKFVIEVLETFQGNVGTAFSLPDTGRGGTPPFTYMKNGVLPAGLNLDSSSGLISGIPLAIESRQVCIFIIDSLEVQSSQCIAITILAALPQPSSGGDGGGGGGVTPPAAPVSPVAAPVSPVAAPASPVAAPVSPVAAPVETSTATVTPLAATMETSTAIVTPLAATMETSTATVGGKSTIVLLIVKPKVHLVLTFTGNRSQLSASHLKLLKKLSKQLGTTKVKIAGLRIPTKSGNEYLIAHKRSRDVVKALKKLEPSSDVISTPYYSAVPDACRQSSSKVKKQCVVIFSTGK